MMELWLALRALGSRGVPATEQQDAAAALMTRARDCAPGVLRRKFGFVDEAIVDDAISELGLRAAVGTAIFQGSTEQEACSWCVRVVRNTTSDELRRRGMSARRPHASLDDAGPTPALVDASDPATVLHLRDIARYEDRLREICGGGRHGREKLKKLEVLFAHRLERVSEADIGMAFGVSTGLLYQWIHRAREYAAEALTQLAKEQPDAIPVLDDLADQLDIVRGPAAADRGATYAPRPRRRARGSGEREET